MTPEQFDAEFAAKVRKHYATDKRLVHLGIPTHERVVVWVAPGKDDTDVQWSEARADGATAPSIHVSEAGPLRLEFAGLQPATRHLISLPRDENHLDAWTAPDPAKPAEARFLAFGCFSPFGHDEKGEVSQATVHALHLLRERSRYADFALASGDQVYVDEGGYKSRPPPRTMVVGRHAEVIRYEEGKAAECFDVLYRVFFSIPALDTAFAQMPTAMMWDDHDIRDGWGSQGDEQQPRWQAHYAAARSRFIGWQMLRNPNGAEVATRPELHFDFDWGSTTSVFVMDQRSARDFTAKRAISDAQLEAMKAWLARSAGTPGPRCFVLVSPLPLTIEPNIVFDAIEHGLEYRADDRRDTWASEQNRGQLDLLLTALVDHFDAHPEHRLLVISGDMHYHDVRELQTPARGVFGHEIVASGIAQPLFAPLGGDQTFLKKRLAAKRLTCFRGPGFAEVVVSPDGSVGVMLHIAALGGPIFAKPHVLVNATGSSWARTLGRMQTLALTHSKEWSDHVFLDPAKKKTAELDADDWSDPFP